MAPISGLRSSRFSNDGGAGSSSIVGEAVAGADWDIVVDLGSGSKHPAGNESGRMQPKKSALR